MFLFFKSFLAKTEQILNDFTNVQQIINDPPNNFLYNPNSSNHFQI